MSSLPTMISAPTLGSGNLRDVVSLPAGESVDEWLTVNSGFILVAQMLFLMKSKTRFVIDVFNQVHMLYGTICDVCTHESCPVMSAGPHHEYFWKDGDKIIPTSAPVYIDYVMTSVQDQLDDENIFPSKIGQQFPRNFKHICDNIMKRLFRIYAHIYHAHYNRLRELKAVAHANTSLKQFVIFSQQFGLVGERDMQPLQRIIRDLLGHSNSTV